MTHHDEALERVARAIELALLGKATEEYAWTESGFSEPFTVKIDGNVSPNLLARAAIEAISAGAEPVAWRVRPHGDKVWHLTDDPSANLGYERQPLYAFPPPPETREAAPMKPGWKPGPQWKFAYGDPAQKHSGSWWEGVVCGFYSTPATPRGYGVQQETMSDNGPVQIYPEAALEPAAIRARGQS
jgi:hypothetical protein